MKVTSKALYLAAATLAGATTGCPGGKDGPGFGACPLDFSGDVDSSFGDPAIDKLLETTGRFSVAAAAIDDDVRSACNAIAVDLGGATSVETAAACENAKTKIDALLEANADAVLTIEYVPSVCSVEAEAFVDCTGQCDASFNAQATPPTCTGGEMSGTCSGECSGSCSVDVTAACSGTCSGQCNAQVDAVCNGTCSGTCEGTCSQTAGDASCEGTCAGTCQGTCTGTIEGSCSGNCDGSCRADVTGECQGTCRGGCNVEWEAPRCEGGELEVEASAECSASCTSEASFDMDCTEPELIIGLQGVDPAELQALIDTLAGNLPVLIAAAAKAEIVVDATAEFAMTLPDAATAAASIGLDAAACVSAAVQAQIAASAMIEVSFSASVEVSASASASAH